MFKDYHFLVNVLMGYRIALLMCAATVSVIFWPQAVLFFRSIKLHRVVNLSNQLGAGIWLTSCGVVLASIARVVATLYWNGDESTPIVAGISILSIGVAILGYLLHIASYASKRYPSIPYLSYYWTACIAIVSAAGIVLAIWSEH